MCSEFNQNINKDTILDIQKVLRGIKSHSNGGVIRTNQKRNHSFSLGYLKTWFQPNGMGNILSFKKVEKLLVITYNHKEKKCLVRTKV